MLYIMSWEVENTDEFVRWFVDLSRADPGESGERRVNDLFCDEADEEFVVPGGDFAPQAD